MPLFEDQIQQYLDCFEANLDIAHFANTSADGVKNIEQSGLIYRILREEPRKPQRRTWEEISTRLQQYYDDAVRTLACKPEPVVRRHELHERLASSRVQFLEPPKSHDESYRVSAVKLKTLYRTSRAQTRGPSFVSRILADIATLITIVKRDPPTGTILDDVEITISEQDEEAIVEALLEVYEILSANGQEQLVAKLGIYRKSEGSTVIRVELPREMAARLTTAFDQARSTQKLSNDIISVRVLPKPGRTVFDPPRPTPSSDTVTNEVIFERLLRQVSFRYNILRPWRRLWWLMSPSVWSSPLAHLIRESDDRAYATEGLLANNARELRRDLTMAWVLWPAFSVLLLLATLLPLRALIPNVQVGIGVASGLLLSLAGGQVCGSVVAPIAAGAGGIFMSWAFGLVHALIFSLPGGAASVNHATIEKDFFVAVTGGPIGLSASSWPGHVPLAIIALLMFFVGASIALAGWFMAQPMNAGPFRPPDWPPVLGRLMRQDKRFALAARLGPLGIDLVGGSMGFLAGAMIGITLGLYSLCLRLGLSAAAAFALSFGTTGGTVFAGIIHLAKKRSVHDSIIFALVYVATVAALCLTIHNSEAPFDLIALSMLTAIYHATWFTAAFFVGAQYSSRAAVIATTLEGAGGFIGFIVYRMFLA